MKYWFFTIFFCLGINKVYSQTIYGIIKNSKEPLEMVSITLKDNKDNIISYVSSDENGKYNLILDTGDENFSVVFSKYGYEEQNFKFSNNEIKSNHKLDILLKEESEKEKRIEEVVIYQKPKLEEKEDTLSYRANAYKDGTEKNIEDLIKKLPGMSVDDNGKIKYKGQQVEKFLLEGDDIFNDNYVAGTRNISIDMVDQIQAIEKYSENNLLKGIENSDKIALNLKIKKGKMNFSGSASLASGFDERYDANINFLSLSKKNKNFSTINYNNTGENSSPYDYFSNTNTVGDDKIQQRFVSNLIAEPRYSNVLELKRVNINDNYFGNINNIVPLSKNLNLKMNMSYYKNTFLYELENNTNYNLENTNIHTTQYEKSAKEPIRYDASYKLTWNATKKSLLEVSSKWFFEKRNSLSEYVNNAVDLSNGNLNDKAQYISQDILYTNKLDDKKVLQLGFLFSNNYNKQNYKLTPGFDFNQYKIDLYEKNIQNVKAKKSYLTVHSVLIGKNNKNKYQLGISALYQENILSSLLFSNNSEYGNNINYNIFETGINGFYNWNIGDFSVTPTISLKNYFLRLDTHSKNENNDKLIMSPSLKLLYKFNNKSKLYFNFSLEQSPQKINNLYDSYILINNKSVAKSNFSTDFQKTEQALLGYSFYDLMNQFSTSFSITYNNQKNNFFTNTEVSENLIKITNIFLPEKNTNYSFNYMIEKYVPFAQSTFRLNLNYNLYRYKNMVNNSELRNSLYNFIGTEFYWKTALDIPFNFENIFKLQFSETKTDHFQTNQNAFIDNNFKILIKPNKQWSATFSLDYFQPSVNIGKRYYFVDTEIKYVTLSKKWEFFVNGKNLTNIKYFTEYEITDYYKSYSSQKLNNLHILLGGKFQF